MGLPEIEQIDMTEENGFFVYTVNTREECNDKVEIVLSSKRSTDSASVIEAESYWSITSGTVAVKKEKLNGVSNLFLYLKNKKTNVTGTVIRVYDKAFSLKKWYLTESMELAFLPDRLNKDFETSKGMILSYQETEGKQRDCMVDLPNARIRLETLGLCENSRQVTVSLGYYRKEEGATVYGACCAPVSISIAPPKITKTIVSGKKVTLSGDFQKNVPLLVELYSGEQFLKEVDLNGTAIDTRELELSQLYVNKEIPLYLRACYQTESGRSLYSEKTEVVLHSPVMELCGICGESWGISMQQSSIYKISYKSENETMESEVVSGKTFKISKTVSEFDINYINGNAEGPVVKCPLKERAVYVLENSGIKGAEPFYLASDRPDDCKMDKDITVELEQYIESTKDGRFFQLQKTEKGTNLTIKKEIFTAGMDEVHSDYSSLLKQVSAERKNFLSVRGAVLEHLPMRAEEMLFYYYDYCPESGYVGIYEGMTLMTEYTVYQNIPDAGQSSRDLSGFVGTGTAGYPVIERNGKIQIEPFTEKMKFEVAAPRDISSDNKLCGGAGLADLLYKGFSAKYMRLVYPAQFTERTSVGSLCYDRNICLLSADNWTCLENATNNMRVGDLAVHDCAYHYFRGRTVVIPQISIYVCGSVIRVSLGTTLADIQKTMGLKECRLTRMVNGKKLPVKYSDERMPLVAGDSIEL